MLPVVFTMRAHWEKQAYKRSMELYILANRNTEPAWLKEFICSQFKTAKYLWMQPFGIEKWYQNTVADIIHSNIKPYDEVRYGK